MADYVVPNEVVKVDGDDNYDFLVPGDRLLIPSTRTTMLSFENVVGSAPAPIIIINSGGLVTIDDGEWAGFYIFECEHLHITGTGDGGYEYGFCFTDTTNAGIMFLSSRYIEIDHCEFGPMPPEEPEGTVGIRSTTHADEVPPGWVLYDTIIHDNYIHDVHEAMYVGQTDQVPLNGLYVYDNYVDGCLWDGIQLREGVANVEVYGNYVTDVGILWEEADQGGFGISVECDQGIYYRNWIEYCHRGFLVRGAGSDWEIYNNVILDCGKVSDAAGGIYFMSGTGGKIYDNTIVDSYEYGVRLGSNANGGSLYDNIICGTTSGDHIVDHSEGAVTITNNVTGSTASIEFVDEAAEDFRLEVTSPAYETGSVAGYAADDYLGVSRPQGAAADVGAYERAEAETGLSRRIIAAVDDALSYPTSQFETAATGVYLGNDGDWNHNGLRFTNITIPAGSTIDAAYLTFTASLARTADTVRVKITYQDADDPADFSGDNYASFEARARSAAAVDWDFTTDWVVDTEYTSPDLKTLIQALVNEAYWDYGDDLVLFVEDDGSTTNAYRKAYAYDTSAAKAALLEIEYSEPAPPAATVWLALSASGGWWHAEMTEAV